MDRHTLSGGKMKLDLGGLVFFGSPFPSSKPLLCHLCCFGGRMKQWNSKNRNNERVWLNSSHCLPAPVPAPDCLCPAGPTSWSVTFLLNRTSPNILPLRKVMFPGSLHPYNSYKILVRFLDSAMTYNLKAHWHVSGAHLCHWAVQSSPYCTSFPNDLN